MTDRLAEIKAQREYCEPKEVLDHFDWLIARVEDLEQKVSTLCKTIGEDNALIRVQQEQLNDYRNRIGRSGR